MIHVEKNEAVDRFAGRNDVRLNHQRLQHLFCIVFFAVAAGDYRRQAARPRSGRAIRMGNFRRRFLEAQALQVETLIVRPIDVQANRREVNMHGIFRVVLKINVNGQEACLGRINLIEDFFDADCVGAGVRRHHEILV